MIVSINMITPIGKTMIVLRARLRIVAIVLVLPSLRTKYFIATTACDTGAAAAVIYVEIVDVDVAGDAGGEAVCVDVVEPEALRAANIAGDRGSGGCEFSGDEMCLGVRDGLIFLVGHFDRCRRRVELRRRCIERGNEVRGDIEVFIMFRRIAVSFLACYGRAITRNTECKASRKHHAHEIRRQWSEWDDAAPPPRAASRLVSTRTDAGTGAAIMEFRLVDSSS